MKITVRFLASLGTIAGAHELVVDLNEPAGLMELMEQLSAILGPRFVEALYASEDGPVDPYSSVIVDGRAVLLTPRAAVDIHDGSTVVFVPPLGGG